MNMVYTAFIAETYIVLKGEVLQTVFGLEMKCSSHKKCFVFSAKKSHICVQYQNQVGVCIYCSILYVTRGHWFLVLDKFVFFSFKVYKWNL